MAYSKEQIIKMIDLDEPDYSSIVGRLSNDDIPVLVELAQHNNPAIATKAISCLGHINSELTLQGIQLAAASTNPVYRLAAAHALQFKPVTDISADILTSLLNDNDAGVKKMAIRSLPLSSKTKLKNKLNSIYKKETNQFIKTLLKEKLSQWDSNKHSL